MNTMRLVEHKLTKPTRAKRGTRAVEAGESVTRIEWDSPLGTLQFAWQYLNADYAEHVMRKLVNDPGHIEANWRVSTSDKFYVTERSHD